jgi:hypothetical protein
MSEGPFRELLCEGVPSFNFYFSVSPISFAKFSHFSCLLILYPVEKNNPYPQTVTARPGIWNLRSLGLGSKTPISNLIYQLLKLMRILINLVQEHCTFLILAKKTGNIYN